ncbi:hypothetical protein D3C78_1464770 [compost metagenome]
MSGSARMWRPSCWRRLSGCRLAGNGPDSCSDTSRAALRDSRVSLFSSAISWPFFIIAMRLHSASASSR